MPQRALRVFRDETDFVGTEYHASLDRNLQDAGFDPTRDRIGKGRFAQAWFKTLADVYAPYGIDRSRIEQREQKRRAERLRNLAAASSAIAVALVGLTIWALVSRHEATVQRDLATAGQREAEARLAFDTSGDGLIRATLLSATSLRSAQTAAVAFTPEQRLLIAVGNHSVIGFSPSDWRQRFELAHDGSIERVAIDANGSRIATSVRYAGGHDSGVHLARVIDLASREQLAWKYTADGGSSFSHQRMLELIAEQHTSATGGDHALLAQSVSWPSVPVRMSDAPATTTPTWTAAASANVITASHSPTARVIGEWDQQGDVTDLLFLPEDAPRWLLSAGDDGLLRLWPLTAADLISEACARLKRILMPQAWAQLAQSNPTGVGSCNDPR